MIAPLLFALAFNPSGLERADLPVSPDLVCRTQHAIRWKDRPMLDATCKKIADSLARTPTPRLLFAMAINESDLRSLVTLQVSESVSDRGLLGVRCMEGADGKCTNGPARGYTPTELLNPVINIRVANEILIQKGYNLRTYNGGTKERGYQSRIEALLRALDGEVVPNPSKRIRKLIRQIVGAVAVERPTF